MSDPFNFCFRCGAERTPFNEMNVTVQTDEGERPVCGNFAACERRESDALAETFDDSPEALFNPGDAR